VHLAGAADRGLHCSRTGRPVPGKNRLHALRTVLMALALATVLVTIHAVGRLGRPSPAGGVSASTDLSGCGRLEEVAERA
jgi:hypothetical protein